MTVVYVSNGVEESDSAQTCPSERTSLVTVANALILLTGLPSKTVSSPKLLAERGVMATSETEPT